MKHRQAIKPGYLELLKIIEEVPATYLPALFFRLGIVCYKKKVFPYNAVWKFGNQKGGLSVEIHVRNESFGEKQLQIVDK